MLRMCFDKCHMIAPLDLFRTDPNGTLWLDSFPDLEAAKTRARELAASHPGEYFVFSQTTRHKQIVELDTA
jgi:hypothetical protein